MSLRMSVTRDHRVRTAGALALVVVAAAYVARAESPAAGLPARIKERLSQLEAEVRAVQSVRDDLNRKYGDTPGKGSPAYTLTFQFASLISWHNRRGELEVKDLWVTVHALGETAVGYPAACPDWRPGLFEVDASGLRVSSGSVTGTVSVHMNEYNVNPAVIEISGTIDGPQLSGSWKTDGYGGRPVLPRSGPLKATVRQEKAEFRILPKPPERLDLTMSQGWYNKAQWLDQSARIAYQEIRALLMTRDYGIPPAHALRLTMPEVYRYPALAEELKAKPKGKPRKQAAPTPAPDAVPDLDGDMGAVLDKLGGDDGPKDSEATMKNLLVHMGPIAARIAAVRAKVARARDADERGERPQPVVGGETCGDPDFGPWYGEATLTTEGGKTNVIASGQGAGAQHWPCVGNWVCVGPYQQRHRLAETPLLPEILPDLDNPVPLSGYMPGRNGDIVNSPGPAGVESGSGYVKPAYALPADAANKHNASFPGSTFYAVTTVFSEEECERWVGVVVNDHGKLWVNDRLVWVSPALRHPRRIQETFIFRTRFAKGVNTLMYRGDNTFGQAWFSVRVCTSGQPRTAAEAKRASDAARERIAKAGSPIAGSWGWRYDWTGKFPGGHPPVAWDGDRMINVLWRAPLGFCASTPVIVGDRVLTLDEPHTLLAYDKMSGKRLWSRDVNILLTMDPKLVEEYDALKKRSEEAFAELAALSADPREWKGKLAAKGMSDGEADAKIQELKRQIGSHVSFLKQKASIPGMFFGNDIGYTYPTPVTDGKRVFVKLNTGALACVMPEDGAIRWIAHHGCVDKNVGALPSPILWKNKVVVYGPVHDRTRSQGNEEDVVDMDDAPSDKFDYNHVRAFDADTGKMVWSTKFWSYGAYWCPGAVCGTPVVMTLSNGREEMDVAVTANGSILRLDDGKLLRSFVGCREWYGSPISDGGNRVIIAAQSQKAAYELIMQDRDNIGVKTLWYNEHPGVFQDGNYGIYHGGRLFYSRPLLDVTDMDSGRLEWCSGNIFFTRPGRGYAPNCMAGGNMYVADNAQWFQPTYRPGLCKFPGAMAVVQPGVPCITLAKNHIEQLHGGFAFDGDRMYVRSMKSLMCYGYTGEEGRNWEAEQVATEVLHEVNDQRPVTMKPALPATELTVDGQRSGARLVVSGGAMGPVRAWLFAGPLDPRVAAEAAKALSAPEWKGWFSDGKAECAVGGQTIGFRGLTTGNLKEWAAEDPFNLRTRQFGTGPHIGWGELFGDFLEVPLVAKPEAGKVALMATVLASDVKRFARFDGSHPNVAKAWIGGTEIASNHLVELPQGHVPLVVMLKLDGPGDRFLVRPQFRWASGMEKDVENWVEYMNRIRPHLENAAKRVPNTAVGRRAREVLSQL